MNDKILSNLPELKTYYMDSRFERKGIDEYERKKRRQIAFMRSLMDYGIGVLILATGVFLFFRDKFDLSFNETFKPNAIDKIFGGMCIVYGCWRIYRGYKKNYFR